MRKRLLEDRRTQLLSKSKKGRNYVWWNQHKGKNRFERRLKSRVASSVKNFNNINMDKFFKTDTLDVSVDVKGETNSYVVRMSFSGTLEEVKRDLDKGRQLDKKLIMQSLTRAFNKNDVYTRCSCPDFKYRFAYWNTRNGLIIGDKEDRPSNITNPHDDLGAGCKHIILATSDASWLIRVASVIWNYINFMEIHREDLYQKYIYPAIHGEEYPNRQLNISDIEGQEEPELDTDKEIINMANAQARKRGQFQPGNKYRFQKAPDNRQQTFDFDSLENEE